MLIFTVALARCDDSPSAPTGSDSINRAGSEGPSPVACITTDPNPPEVAALETVVLDAGCSANVGAAASYEWDLGDGRRATGSSVEARYRRSGEFTVRLNVRDRGATSEATAQVRVRQRAKACFTFSQVMATESEEPCTVTFDATCSEGSVKEYRWFFEAGVPADVPIPDPNVDTNGPRIVHSWRQDMECFAFRPFDRLVRLTVVDEGGATDSHEETVEFAVPFLRP